MFQNWIQRGISSSVGTKSSTSIQAGLAQLGYKVNMNNPQIQTI